MSLVEPADIKAFPRLEALIRYGYCPLMLVGVNGLAIWLVAAGWGVALAPLLGVAIATSFVAERALSYQPDWNRSHGDVVRDGLHAFVNEIANFSESVWRVSVPAESAS